MEDRILVSTKKVLGLQEEYTPFDQDVIIYINSAFSILTQLGVGPTQGFMINDETAVWSDFLTDTIKLNLVRTYVFLKVRMLFDPPQTSFLINATNELIAEYEGRISIQRELETWPH